MADSLVQYPMVHEDSHSSVTFNEPEKPNSYACNICNQTYTRVDHLNRHYRSRKAHSQETGDQFVTKPCQILEKSHSLAPSAERTLAEREC